MYANPSQVHILEPARVKKKSPPKPTRLSRVRSETLRIKHFLHSCLRAHAKSLLTKRKIHVICTEKGTYSLTNFFFPIFFINGLYLNLSYIEHNRDYEKLQT